MPISTPELKKEIIEYINTFPEDSTILDVGAGAGIYRKLLYNYKNMDCVEIHKPYIKKYFLEKLYRNVFPFDIRNFKHGYYDIIIYGDILEHLAYKDCLEVLKWGYNHSKEMIISIPYQYKQGIIENNPNEIHLQDNLTNESILTLYPMLELVKKGKIVGFYRKNTKTNIIPNSKNL